MNDFPFAPWLVTAAFAVAVAATMGGALLAALSTRIVRGVGGLMICCIGLAGLYYFLNSPFLALMEILIYVGAVCVTIVFGVMLSEPDEAPQVESRRRAWGWGGAAVLLAAGVFLGVSRLSLGAPWPDPGPVTGDGSIHGIGVSLLTTYSLAFELISLVLLVAIMGALVIARAGRSTK
jgi:NADH:ubiquinone oxidoreductase subunit 6 (subunit J)